MKQILLHENVDLMLFRDQIEKLYRKIQAENLTHVCVIGTVKEWEDEGKVSIQFHIEKIEEESV